MQNQPPSPRASSRRAFLAAAAALGVSVSLAGRVTAAADEKKATGTAGGGAGGEGGDKVILFNGKDLTGWKTSDEKAKDHWNVVGEVKLDDSQKKLVGSGTAGEGPGALLLVKSARGADLVTEQAFGDGEYHVEVMVPKGSNSGIYLQGQYEVQVLDSHGKQKVGPGDLGGIYVTKAPSENAAKAPGEWQTFHITFRAPRFDADGKKTENAKFVKVVLNGKTIHENVEAPKPTGGELPGGEKAKGPLMFQGDHGIVAFRNVWVKPADAK